MSSFLSILDISKRFDGVVALKNVNLTIDKATIHGIVGENGAGKSTLMKIVAGVHPVHTYEGSIRINKQIIQLHSVADAEKNGIFMIPQEITVVEELSVTENILLNRLPKKYGIVDWKGAREFAEEIINHLGIAISPDAHLKELRTAHKQLVMIARALSVEAKIIIFDEPTTCLTKEEKKSLFEKMRSIKRDGVTCLYVTHNLEELKEIVDELTIMRDGQIVGNYKSKDLTEKEIVSLMIGRDIQEMYPSISKRSGKPLLEVKNFHCEDVKIPDRFVVKNVSFTVKSGEIVGLFGLVGSGRTELALGIYGAWKGRTHGEIYIDGVKREINNPTESIKLKLGYLSEDRKNLSIIEKMSVKDNITVSSLKEDCKLGVINTHGEELRSSHFINQLDIKTSGMYAPITSLSGGNQQKVIVARLLAMKATILLLDEPTHGVDVGAKNEIYILLKELAMSGKSILFITSDLNEAIGCSDRILVMRQGEIVAEVEPKAENRENIMQYCTLGAKK